MEGGERQGPRAGGDCIDQPSPVLALIPLAKGGSGISPTALLTALHFASRHLSGINECLDAAMWQRSTVAVHAIAQGRAVQPVLSAELVIGRTARATVRWACPREDAMRRLFLI